MIRRLKPILFVLPLLCSFTLLLAGASTDSTPLMLYKLNTDGDYDRSRWIVLHQGLLGIGQSQNGVRAWERQRQQRREEIRHRLEELDRRANELIRGDAPPEKLREIDSEEQADLRRVAMDLAIVDWIRVPECHGGPGFHVIRWSSSLFSQYLQSTPPSKRHGFLGFYVSHLNPKNVIGASFITLPLWFLAALFALPGLLFIPKLRRLRRARAGLCLSCGYDLRATPEKCPECGHVVTSP
jgi:hypothetical protein